MTNETLPAPDRRLSVVLSGVFLVLVMVPLVALVLGVRTSLPDNRTPVEFPDGSELATLDVAAWSQAQEAFRDRLPGLGTAVAADARIDLALIGRSPNPQVRLGEGEWLFLSTTIDRPCLSEEKRARIRDGVRQLREAAADSGHRLVLLVVPDKATVHEDHLRPEDRERSCARRDWFTIMEDLAGPDLLDPLPILEGLDAEGETPYWPKDTHWTTPAASRVVDALVEHLGGRPEGATLRVGGLGAGATDDLAALVGLPTGRPSECWDQERPGVTLTGKADACRWHVARPIRLDATSQGPPLLPPTLFQFDSFGLRMIEVMGPWFDRVTALYKDNVDDATMTAAVQDAEVLVVQIVQRSLAEELFAWGLPERLSRAMRGEATS